MAVNSIIEKSKLKMPNPKQRDRAASGTESECHFHQFFLPLLISGVAKNPGFYKNKNENFILLKMNKNEIQNNLET